jgi:Ca2+-binding RTX toxin-like protein
MSDAIKNSNNSLTTLSGMSEANSTVSVFDGTKPLGTVTADSSGDWSLQANISGGTHQFTETSTDVAGNTGASAGVTDYAPGGNKTLTGGSGNDFLIGGKNDTLVGGAGNDTFVFNQGFGKETVADFNVNQDALAFDHTLFAHDTAAQVLSQAHDTSAGAVIVADAHDTVTLNGVTVAQLQAAQMAHLNWIHFV